MKIILLASSGEQIERSANGIIFICYRILHLLDSHMTLDSTLVKRELKQLINQVVYRKPPLKADGFFVINFTMLGFATTSLTSHLIVGIQFVLNDKQKRSSV